MARLKKGSAAVKRFMAKIRAKRKTNTRTKRRRVTKSKSFVRKREVKPMARRRRISRRRITRKKGMFGGFITKDIIGMGLAGATEPFVDGLINRFVPAAGLADDVVKIFGGLLLAKKTSGVVSGWAKGMALLGVANLSRSFATPLIGQFTGGGTVTQQQLF